APERSRRDRNQAQREGPARARARGAGGGADPRRPGPQRRAHGHALAGREPPRRPRPEGEPAVGERGRPEEGDRPVSPRDRPRAGEREPEVQPRARPLAAEEQQSLEGGEEDRRGDGLGDGRRRERLLMLAFGIALMTPAYALAALPFAAAATAAIV